MLLSERWKDGEKKIRHTFLSSRSSARGLDMRLTMGLYIRLQRQHARGGSSGREALEKRCLREYGKAPVLCDTRRRCQYK